jgi:hypothetical protein
MRRILEKLIKASLWISREIVTGPSKDAIAFTEELDKLLDKYDVGKRSNIFRAVRKPALKHICLCGRRCGAKGVCDVCL